MEETRKAYRCPSCGAPASCQNRKCDYCGTEFEPLPCGTEFEPLPAARAEMGYGTFMPYMFLSTSIGSTCVYPFHRQFSTHARRYSSE